MWTAGSLSRCAVRARQPDPGGSAGVVIDDSQPYPVFGFLEIRWHPADVVGNP
jgi:hypothetical protein